MLCVLNLLPASGRIGVYTNGDMTEFEDLLARAEAGEAKAQFSLAQTYAFKKGRGVLQSNREAYRWYRLAVEQDPSLAQLLDGADTKDWERLCEEEAATDGDADKQVALGHRYLTGEGVPQDYAAAARWYQQAADQGHATARHHLGVCYANGEGVAQDDAEAFRWYQLAAEQGHFGAQVDLARSYLEGFGVSQDYELAHIWANRAVGHAPRDSREAAITLRDQAETHFSSSEILALQRRARAELASSGLERPVSNTPKPVTDPAPASSNPNQGLSTPSVTTSGAPIGERAAGDVSVVDPGVHRPAERAKVSPLVIAVVIAGIAVMLWMFRYEYEATVLNLPNVPSVSYQIRTDRWTGETCYVYPPGRLSAIPAMLLGQSCGATQ